MSQPSNDQNRLQPGPLAAVHGVEAPQTAAGRTSSEPCQISMFCRVRKQDKNIQNITKRKVLTFYRLSCQRVHARSCLSMAINDWVFNDVWRIIAQDVSRAVNLAAWPRMFGVHQFIMALSQVPVAAAASENRWRICRCVVHILCGCFNISEVQDTWITPGLIKCLAEVAVFAKDLNDRTFFTYCLRLKAMPKRLEEYRTRYLAI